MELHKKRLLKCFLQPLQVRCEKDFFSLLLVIECEFL